MNGSEKIGKVNPDISKRGLKLISEKVLLFVAFDAKNFGVSYKLHWQEHEKNTLTFLLNFKIYCPNKCFPFLSFVKENKLLIMRLPKKFPSPFVSPHLFNLNNLAGISSLFKLVL